jgi:hypothetical protein
MPNFSRNVSANVMDQLERGAPDSHKSRSGGAVSTLTISSGVAHESGNKSSLAVLVQRDECRISASYGLQFIEEYGLYLYW